jgi:hypothetical protein
VCSGGKLMLTVSASGTPEPASTYCLELHIRPRQPGQAWAAFLEGTAPKGRPIERREFGSLMDLMRFLEALVTEGGLR